MKHVGFDVVPNFSSKGVTFNAREEESCQEKGRHQKEEVTRPRSDNELISYR
jgi:hypothetical protein